MNIATTTASSSFQPYSGHPYSGMGPLTRIPDTPQDPRTAQTQPVPPAGTGREGTEKSSPRPRAADQQSPAGPRATEGLTDADLRLLEELKKADRSVRRHEMAHVAAGGRYITSGANFNYKRGPDGVNYAVGGEVSIDTSPVPGDPEATIAKMRQVKTAALAPADPSPQDIKVASMATAQATKAMTELMVQQAKDRAQANEDRAFGSIKTASDSYVRVKELPDQDTTSFKLAV